MNDTEMTMIMRVAKWVAETYGIAAITDMATNLPMYIDAYNEAMLAFAEKLSKSERNQPAMEALTESVYHEIRGEVV